MTLTEFEASVTSGHMPDHLSDALKTLWLSKAGKWHEAHDICQEMHDRTGSWLHAHLHREEGDLWNADYWYQRAGKKSPGKNVTIEQEWQQMVQVFLTNI